MNNVQPAKILVFLLPVIMPLFWYGEWQFCNMYSELQDLRYEVERRKQKDLCFDDVQKKCWLYSHSQIQLYAKNYYLPELEECMTKYGMQK